MSDAMTGMPRLLLRVEAMLMLAGAATAYGLLVGDWPRFALLFLVPDLSMLGYLGGLRLGALFYNAAHSHIAPLILIGWGALGHGPGCVTICLIWVAHIGCDRMLGYGLKSGEGFDFGHLGRMGRAARR